MRIERLQHPINRTVNESVSVNLVDVVSFDYRKGVGEGLILLRHPILRRQNSTAEQAARKRRNNHDHHHHRKRTNDPHDWDRTKISSYLAMSSENGPVEPSLTGSEHVPIMRAECFYALEVQSRSDCSAARCLGLWVIRPMHPRMRV